MLRYTRFVVVTPSFGPEIETIHVAQRTRLWRGGLLQLSTFINLSHPFSFILDFQMLFIQCLIHDAVHGFTPPLQPGWLCPERAYTEHYRLTNRDRSRMG